MLIFPSCSLGVKFFAGLLPESMNSHSTHKSCCVLGLLLRMVAFPCLALGVVSAFPSPILQQPGETTKQERLRLIQQSRVLEFMSLCSSLCKTLATECLNCTTWDVSNLNSLPCIPFSTQTPLVMLFPPLFSSSVAIISINNCASTPVTPRSNFVIEFSLSSRSSSLQDHNMPPSSAPQYCHGQILHSVVQKILHRRAWPKTMQTSCSK